MIPIADLKALISETKELRSIVRSLKFWKKPPHPQIRHTLAVSWSFAVPFAIETLAQNKFLLGVSDPTHVDTILRQGPWNIRGSLLQLKLWSPELAIAEIELTHSPFWVQIHGLPCPNMALKNAIMIGKALGDILAIENLNTSGLVCCQYLRIKVNIDTSQPLKPGFHPPRSDKIFVMNLWVIIVPNVG
jgi:hypothetical protein